MTSGAGRERAWWGRPEAPEQGPTETACVASPATVFVGPLRRARAVPEGAGSHQDCSRPAQRSSLIHFSLLVSTACNRSGVRTQVVTHSCRAVRRPVAHYALQKSARAPNHNHSAAHCSLVTEPRVALAKRAQSPDVHLCHRSGRAAMPADQPLPTDFRQFACRRHAGFLGARAFADALIKVL